MKFPRKFLRKSPRKFPRKKPRKFIVFFLYKNLQLVYPPYDMAPSMRIPMPNCVFDVLSVPQPFPGLPSCLYI